MSSVPAIKVLVNEIGTLCNTLSDAVPRVSKAEKIWSVMKTDEYDTPHETLNRHFDALLGEDCRDSNDRLHHVRQGKFSILSYLSKVNWAVDFPLDFVELKLQHLIAELKHLQ